MDATLSLTGPTLRHTRATTSIRTVHEGELTDGELIERVGEGDRDAFEELYRRYTRPVLGLALRRLGDRGRAEDALQDAFAAIWRSAASYDPARGQGGAWLYTVARNAIVDGARKRPEPPVEVPDEPSGENGPPEQAEAAWLAWRVHSALEHLPEHERPVIELAYWGGLSQSEISEFLHVPLGTVKTRTRSALCAAGGSARGGAPVSDRFDELVGEIDDPAERKRLMRVHELLLSVDAPPERATALDTAPVPERGTAAAAPPPPGARPARRRPRRGVLRRRLAGRRRRRRRRARAGDRDARRRPGERVDRAAAAGRVRQLADATCTSAASSRAATAPTTTSSG